MGAGSGFPIDLVLFAMIAAFLVLRLRSVLGRRQGFERPPEARPPEARPSDARSSDARSSDARPSAGDARTPDGRPQPVVVPLRPDGKVIDLHPEPVSTRTLPEPASPAGQALAAMRQADPGFDPQRFLAGAETAFRMIVAAFATGDRATLRPLLSDETYAAFDGAIAGRETAGETQRTEIRSLHGTAIEAAALHGTDAEITLRFVSDQINVTLGANGLPVAGADAVTEITDVWTLARNLATSDPTWRLIAARSA